MKLKCDCGNEVELTKIEENLDFTPTYERYECDESKFIIEGWCDYAFIKCIKCKKDIRID